MINSLNRRFLQFANKKQFYFVICRRETTSIVKRSDVQEQLEKKMKFYMKIYEDLFGITKFTEMQNKVTEIQINFEAIQEKRRKMQEEIFAVQRKLEEMQGILRETSVDDDDKYMSVFAQVRKLQKEQKRLQDIFSLYDQTEREQMTSLFMAIRTTQDYERTYREKNKYLSLITGVIGGVVGCVWSSINNWRHRKDISHFASDINEQVVELKKSVDNLKLTGVTNGALLSADDSPEEAKHLLSSIASQHNKLEESIKSFILNNSAMNKNSSHVINDSHTDNNFNEFEKNLTSKLNYHTYVNLGLVGSYTLLFSVLLFYMIRS